LWAHNQEGKIWLIKSCIVGIRGSTVVNERWREPKTADSIEKCMERSVDDIVDEICQRERHNVGRRHSDKPQGRQCGVRPVRHRWSW